MTNDEVMERRGWQTGINSAQCKYAPRQCVKWTDKEDFDLYQQHLWGLSHEWLAVNHQRSHGAIYDRLRLPERAQAGYERYLAGVPKPKPPKYVSKKRLKYLKEKHMGAKRYQRIIKQEKQHGY